MSASDSSAHNYALALYELACEAHKEAAIQSDIKSFLDLLSRSADLSIALSHPGILRPQRRSIIGPVLAKCGYDDLSVRFIKLVVDRGRIPLFARIVEAYHAIGDKAAGRRRGVVHVAYPLDEAQLQRLKEKIRTQIGTDVVLEEHIDPTIIGGFCLELDGRAYDSSIRRHLERLGEKIHAGKLH
ncbi:MAG: ATP synthase F1 subunit delta [Proteobacteria bacterium]|nr:ATP synthase F1 subunit delta [Pseudomonadota bacterium]